MMLFCHLICHCEPAAKQSPVRCVTRLFALTTRKRVYQSVNLRLVTTSEIASSFLLAMTRKAMTTHFCHCEPVAKQSLVRCADSAFPSRFHKIFQWSANLLLVSIREIAALRCATLAMTNAEIGSSFFQGCRPTNVNAMTKRKFSSLGAA